MGLELWMEWQLPVLNLQFICFKSEKSNKSSVGKFVFPYHPPSLLPQLLPSKMGPWNQNVLENFKFSFFADMCLNVCIWLNTKGPTVKNQIPINQRSSSLSNYVNNFKDTCNQKAQLRQGDISDMSRASPGMLFMYHTCAVWLRIIDEASK